MARACVLLWLGLFVVVSYVYGHSGALASLQSSSYCRNAVRHQNRNPQQLFNEGEVLYSSKNYDSALPKFLSLVCFGELDDHQLLGMTLYNAAGVLLETQRPADAILFYEAGYHYRREANLLFNYGVALIYTGNHAQAIRVLDELLDGRMGDANIMEQAQRAKEVAKAQLSIHGQRASGHSPIVGATSQENIHLAMEKANHGDFESAVTLYRRAVELDETSLSAQYGLGSSLTRLKRFEEGIYHLIQASKLDPQNHQVYFSIGLGYSEAGDRRHAIEYYLKAVEMKPDYFQALNNLAVVYSSERDFNNAIKYYRLAYKEAEPFLKSQGQGVDEGRINILGNLVDTLAKVADWSERKQHEQIMARSAKEMVRSGKATAIDPFSAMVSNLPGDLCRQIAESHANGYARTVSSFSPFSYSEKKMKSLLEGRMKLGFVSSNFGNHTVAYNMQSMFGMYDRSQFAVTCYSANVGDSSHWNAKIRAECESFVDIFRQTDSEVANLINAEHVNVLMNLNGHTRGHRNGIFVLQPAPIQALFYGFVGTSGASHIAYVVTDPLVSPPAFRDLYTERLLFMPDTFFVTDYRYTSYHSAAVTGPMPTRDSIGIHDEETVLFASFNQMYKITPQVFELWIRILNRVENSKLWLPRFPPEAEPHLKKNAKRMGLDPKRLHFTPIGMHEDHLRMKRLADVFLDPFPFNAHTTGADILWAGVPAITKPGAVMASRVGVTLANAAQIPEMVVSNLQQYEDLAVYLATNSTARSLVKEKLVTRRFDSPLFDTSRWVQNHQRSLRVMWDSLIGMGKTSRHHLVVGKPPRDPGVSRSPPTSQNPVAKGNADGKRLWTDEIAEHASVDRDIIIGFANYGYRHFARNWYYFLNKSRTKNVVVFALDEKLCDYLAKWNIPCTIHPLVHETSISPDTAAYGSQNFKRMMYLRARIVVDIMSAGYNMLLCDMDIVVFRNPFKYIHKVLGRNLGLFAVDAPTYVTKETTRFFNGGFFYLKASSETTKFVEGIVDRMIRAGDDDQVSMSTMLKDGQFPRYDIFDQDYVVNGIRYFGEKQHLRTGKVPYALHANWIYGTDGKMFRLRSQQLWMVDDDEYFESPGLGFLKIEISAKANISADVIHSTLMKGLILCQHLQRTCIVPFIRGGGYRAKDYENNIEEVSTLDQYYDIRKIVAAFDIRENNFLERRRKVSNARPLAHYTASIHGRTLTIKEASSNTIESLDIYDGKEIINAFQKLSGKQTVITISNMVDFSIPTSAQDRDAFVRAVQMRPEFFEVQSHVSEELGRNYGCAFPIPRQESLAGIYDPILQEQYRRSNSPIDATSSDGAIRMMNEQRVFLADYATVEDLAGSTYPGIKMSLYNATSAAFGVLEMVWLDTYARQFCERLVCAHASSLGPGAVWSPAMSTTCLIRESVENASCL